MRGKFGHDGKMKNPISRRSAIVTGILGGAGMIALPQLSSAIGPTPPETEGPFYPVRPQKDKDFDLTQVEGKAGKAEGDIIEVRGRILDVDGEPISDATVDLWQANAAGKYDHPRDPNPAKIDPNFQGWAIVPSGEDGGFKFKTIKPGAYPATRDWDRPPHIHFKISKAGFQPLTTQMYFPGDPLNEKDLLIKRKSAENQKLMMSEEVEEGVFTWDIYLAPRGKRGPQAD